MRRINRDATKDELIKALCDPKTGVFTEIWRLLLFAALLGKAKNKREPLKQVTTNEGIRAEVFANSPIWLGLIHLLGVTETENSLCLKSDQWEQSLLLFEEYANGGLELLSRMVGISAMNTPDFLQAAINELLPSPTARREEDISGIRI